MNPRQYCLCGDWKDWKDEKAAIDMLRRIGEAAARQAGMQPVDIDEVGVDFATFILTERIEPLRDYQGSKTAYLWRSARWFTAHQRRQLRRSRVVLMERIEEAEPPPAEAWRQEDIAARVLQHDLLERVQRAVARLSERDQLLYQMCVVEGVNCSEAAVRLNCKPAAARKRLERIRRQVRGLFKDQ